VPAIYFALTKRDNSCIFIKEKDSKRFSNVKYH